MEDKQDQHQHHEATLTITRKGINEGNVSNSKKEIPLNADSLRMRNSKLHQRNPETDSCVRPGQRRGGRRSSDTEDRGWGCHSRQDSLLVLFVWTIMRVSETISYLKQFSSFSRTVPFVSCPFFTMCHSLWFSKFRVRIDHLVLHLLSTLSFLSRHLHHVIPFGYKDVSFVPSSKLLSFKVSWGKNFIFFRSLHEFSDVSDVYRFKSSESNTRREKVKYQAWLFKNQPCIPLLFTSFHIQKHDNKTTSSRTYSGQAYSQTVFVLQIKPKTCVKPMTMWRTSENWIPDLFLQKDWSFLWVLTLNNLIHCPLRY